MEAPFDWGGSHPDSEIEISDDSTSLARTAFSTETHDRDEGERAGRDARLDGSFGELYWTNDGILGGRASPRRHSSICWRRRPEETVDCRRGVLRHDQTLSAGRTRRLLGSAVVSTHYSVRRVCESPIDQCDGRIKRL